MSAGRAERRRAWLPAALVAAVVVAPATGLPPADDGSERVVLTGSLRAKSAERLDVPVTSSWNLKLEWLIEEGLSVEPGDVIARFDTSRLGDQLTDAENELAGKRQQRDAQESEGELQRLELELGLARAETEYRKAALEASVPEGILGGRDFRERQLTAATRKKEYEDALAALSTQETTLGAALTAADLELERLEERIADLRREIDALNLVATRAGIVVHEDHPWYGRKVRQGDQVQATFPVASIPDLTSLEVEAWAAEVEVGALEPGQRARFVLDAFPGRRFAGRVTAIGRAGEPRAAWGRAPYFRITLDLDDPDVEVMKPGMSVRCEVGTGVPARVAKAGTESP